jgi:hypothetical protein
MDGLHILGRPARVRPPSRVERRDRFFPATGLVGRFAVSCGGF